MYTELPEFKHLLCLWHISKNILGHIPRFFPGLEGSSVTSILQGWNRVVSWRTEEALESNIETFIRNLPKRNSGDTATCDLLKFVAYIQRDKFVSAWTDKFAWLYTTSSSRLDEGAHMMLKRHLKSLTSDLGYVFNLMDTVLKQQHTEITVLKENYQTCFENGISTTFALAKIDVLSSDPKSKLAPCIGVFTKFLGIPCAHRIKQKLLDHESSSLAKDKFHRQWWITETSQELDD
ncbi:hypothetical protein [Parasitella parasitica]|uniref:MULE transposase domain-containing protein n=1 Tax=Parasitella parasitica TaxID=35722 RepID=A0A0B7N1N7_9FUNG|nr:hypothetical protein [Parasitella parasitica]